MCSTPKSVDLKLASYCSIAKKILEKQQMLYWWRIAFKKVSKYHFVQMLHKVFFSSYHSVIVNNCIYMHTCAADDTFSCKKKSRSFISKLNIYKKKKILILACQPRTTGTLHYKGSDNVWRHTAGFKVSWQFAEWNSRWNILSSVYLFTASSYLFQIKVPCRFWSEMTAQCRHAEEQILGILLLL